MMFAKDLSMLAKVTNGKIVMGICLSKSLKETIDIKRGDIPRSKYISRILEQQLDHKKDVENQQSQSRPLPGQKSANPLSLSATTRCDGDAADDR
jgi:hypothetical protein